MPKINVIIDRDMLIGELYNLRSYIEPDNEEIKKAISNLVDLVLKAPTNEQTAAYPRIRVRHL
jgi:hypothetical protein